MAIRRGFKVNVKANVDSTRMDSIFVDIKQDSTRRLRFLPPPNEDGTLFTKIVNHFKLKSDDDPPRGMAVGCNDHFNGEDCYLCRLSKTLKKDGDKAEKKIGDDIRASARFYAPVLVAEKNEDGEWVYDQKVKLVGLPKTAVDDISALLVQQDMVGDDFFCDVEKGQDVLITRTGTGFQTKYKISLCGQKMDLNDIMGEDVKEIEDVVEACNVNLVSNDEQRAAAVRTYGDDLDWDALAEEYGL
jgi:hypothetical protein